MRTEKENSKARKEEMIKTIEAINKNIICIQSNILWLRDLLNKELSNSKERGAD